MKCKTLTIVSFLLFALASSSAFAQSHAGETRKGIFTGVGFNMGGGQGYSSTDEGTRSIGSREFDGGLSFLVGYNFLGWLNTEFELTWTGTQTTISIPGGFFNTGTTVSWWNHNTTLMVGAEFFVFYGLHLDFLLGLAISTATSTGSNVDVDSASNAGFALKFGFGYEHIVWSNLAIGGKFYYARNFYSRAHYDTISVGFGAKWYF